MNYEDAYDEYGSYQTRLTSRQLQRLSPERKFNPYHDRRGRFTVRGGGNTSMDGVITPDPETWDLAKDPDTQHLFNKDGTYTPTRQALHEAIIDEALAGIPVDDDKQFFLMGGGWGAGKSTVVNQGKINVPGRDKAVYVNPDEIKPRLPEHPGLARARNFQLAPIVHEESSDIARQMMNRATGKGADLVFDGAGDSTLEKLSGKLNEARSRGYKIHANYVTVPTAVALERAIARANNPKSEGFRRMPNPAELKAVHKAVSDIFPRAVEAKLFDTAKLWDNTNGVKLVMEYSNGKSIIHDPTLWANFIAKASE